MAIINPDKCPQMYVFHYLGVFFLQSSDDKQRRI